MFVKQQLSPLFHLSFDSFFFQSLKPSSRSMFKDNKPNREFQSGLKPEDLRRNRQDDRLRLRRADRENRLQSKRQALSNRNRTYGDNQNNNNSQQQNDGVSLKRNQMLQQLPQFVKGCYSDHPATQFECTQRIRKLLSIERDPPIKQVIDSGVVTRLVQFLHHDNYDRLQFEAAWALTNIASGTAENTAVVIRYGAVPIFVKLLESKSDEVKEQAIWALGNIAGDSPECRNLVLSHNALNNLLPLCKTTIQTQAQLTLLRNAAWTLSNFCRGKPCPEWKYVQLALKALAIMITSDDQEILQDSCWAFSYLSDIDGSSQTEQQQIQLIISSGSLARLVNLLDHESPHVRHPSLRTIGNIVTGCDEQTQYVLNMGVLKKLANLMQNDRAPIAREACWTISNITAGSKDQIEAVVAANLLPPLIKTLTHGKFEVAKEALWAISNATSGGSDPQIKYLVNQGVIPGLCKFLNYSQVPAKKCLLVALEGIENILQVGARVHTVNGMNPFATYVEECGGVDSLEELQSNQTIPDEIYEKAQKLICEYFDGDEVIGPNDNGSHIANTNNGNQNNSFNGFGQQTNGNGNTFGFGMANNNNQSNGGSGFNF